MPFGYETRNEIREKAGYHCQICGKWHQPHKDDDGSRLEAHSIDKTHGDKGLAVCSHKINSCHQRIHDITDDPVELQGIAVTAVNMNNLSMFFELERRGYSEERIKRVLNRAGTI